MKRNSKNRHTHRDRKCISGWAALAEGRRVGSLEGKGDKNVLN